MEQNRNIIIGVVLILILLISCCIGGSAVFYFTSQSESTNNDPTEYTEPSEMTSTITPADDINLDKPVGLGVNYEQAMAGLRDRFDMQDQNDLDSTNFTSYSALNDDRIKLQMTLITNNENEVGTVSLHLISVSTDKSIYPEDLVVVETLYKNILGNSAANALTWTKNSYLYINDSNPTAQINYADKIISLTYYPENNGLNISIFPNSFSDDNNNGGVVVVDDTGTLENNNLGVNYDQIMKGLETTFDMKSMEGEPYGLWHEALNSNDMQLMIVGEKQDPTVVLVGASVSKNNKIIKAEDQIIIDKVYSNIQGDYAKDASLWITDANKTIAESNNQVEQVETSINGKTLILQYDPEEEYMYVWIFVTEE